MTPLTERYLAAAVRGIPGSQRVDVERELRSSIADALEDRVSAGEDRAQAERAVLEGLGDPVRLAAGIAGRPLYLIGPDLFVEYRQLLFMLLSIVMPIVGVIQAGVAIADGDDLIGVVIAGIGGAWTVGLHLFFWVTITFVLIERLDAARDAKKEITAAAGRWTVDRLPAVPPARVTAGETVGEVVTAMITIGGILFLSGVAWFHDASGSPIPLFNPELWGFWMPILIGVLVAQAGLLVIVFLVGGWTMPLAGGHAVLQIAWAAPVISLALSGSLINPAFADALGWPPLAEGSGLPMLGLAGVTAVVAVWEIFDGYRRARRNAATSAGLGEAGEAAR